MRTEPLTRIRRSLAEMIRYIQSTGESIMITDYDAPVAVLSPVPDHLKSGTRKSTDGLPDSR